MYPKEIQDRTLNAFNDLLNSELIKLRFICMKNSDGSFGIITRSDALNGIYEIMNRDSKTCHKYKTAVEMVSDGWVVD